MRIERTIKVDAPRSVVWDYVTDPANYLEFMDGLTRWEVAGGIVLTTADFDATKLDPASVGFGPGLAPESHARGHVEDADGDGDLDLVLHFATQATGLGTGDVRACLVGRTVDGAAVEGCDGVGVAR